MAIDSYEEIIYVAMNTLSRDISYPVAGTIFQVRTQVHKFIC